jgi:drug/metabolite transporter (DMT)-like permease
MALKENAIDAGSFTSIRLISGAVILLVLINIGNKGNKPERYGSWYASLMLFFYAITFSFAYISLDTGTGALILFGSVQITMILISFLKGIRLKMKEWIGVILAFGGFVYLMLPQLTTPSVLGFLLMTMAGISWGMYTLNGRGSEKPLVDTAGNFIKTLPLTLLIIISLLMFGDAVLSLQGIILAILSGALASGVGYAIWYAALKDLTTTQAAVVQLLVPVIAAAGGVLFISESITNRLIISAVLVLGGILLVILGREKLTV